MAEGCSGTGGWWNSWIQTAKEKSSVALEFVKKDLSEFTTTVHSDSKKVLTNVKENLNQDNVSAATQKAKEGVNSLLDGITKVLTVEAEDKHRPRAGRTTASQPIFDRAKARLNAIQIDQGTYVNEPSGSPDEFTAWLESFNLDGYKGEISELLVVNVQVRSLYTQLVPSAVSHADFWQRYFYKLHQLERDEARRAALKKRAEDSSANLAAWDDSEEDTDDWVDMSGPSSPPSESHMLMHDPLRAASNASAQETNSSAHLETKATVDMAAERELPNERQEESQINVVTETVMDRGVNQSEGGVCDSQSPHAVTQSDNVKVEIPGHSRGKESVQGRDDSNSENKESVALPADTEKTSMDSSCDTLMGSSTEGKHLHAPIVTETHESGSDGSSAVAETHQSGSDGSLAVAETHESGSDSSSAVAETHESGSDGSLVVVKGDERLEEKAVPTREKGDLVVVGSAVSSDRTTPTSNSSNKDLEDDWDAEFDIDVTEEDLKLAQQTAADSTEKNQDDEWESWD